VNQQLPDDLPERVEGKPLGQLGKTWEDGGMGRKTDKEFFIRQAYEQEPRKGFELLFRHFYTPLCSHAARYVYTKEVAEDLVAEVFYVFWKKELHGAVTTSFRAYLFTAVRHKCFTYLRWEFDKDKSEDLEDREISSSSSLPDGVMEYDELYLCIEKTINSLPPQCQKVFLMSRFEGKSYVEIAEKLNVSRKAVEAQITRALSELRKVVKDHCISLISLLSIFYN
jgi:RNA polymerase sigma-70 factor (family 1)